MRGGFLPPLILCATLGIALSAVKPRTALCSALIAIVVALAVFQITFQQRWIEFIFTATWLSVIVAATLLYLRAATADRLAFLVAVNSGAWIGAVAAVSGKRTDLAIAVPFLLLFLVGRSIVQRGWGISLKVFSSWLVAVAILATMLSLTPTPGYVPDHME